MATYDVTMTVKALPAQSVPPVSEATAVKKNEIRPGASAVVFGRIADRSRLTRMLIERDIDNASVWISDAATKSLSKCHSQHRRSSLSHSRRRLPASRLHRAKNVTNVPKKRACAFAGLSVSRQNHLRLRANVAPCGLQKLERPPITSGHLIGLLSGSNPFEVDQAEERCAFRRCPPPGQFSPWRVRKCASACLWALQRSRRSHHMTELLA